VEGYYGKAETKCWRIQKRGYMVVEVVNSHGTHQVQSPKHAMTTGVILMCAILIILVILKGLRQPQKSSITLRCLCNRTVMIARTDERAALRPIKT
jgi:hypothetical protein